MSLLYTVYVYPPEQWALGTGGGYHFIPWELEREWLMVSSDCKRGTRQRKGFQVENHVLIYLHHLKTWIYFWQNLNPRHYRNQSPGLEMICFLNCPSKVPPYDSSCESRLFGLLSHFCWIFGRLDLLYIPHQHYNHHNFHDSKSAHQSTQHLSILIRHLLDDRVSLRNGIFILFPKQTYKFPQRRAKKTQTKHFRIIGGFLWRRAAGHSRDKNLVENNEMM